MRTLHVITHRKWIADDLQPGAPADLTIRHDLGLDLPNIQPADALWTPMEWATRALHDPRIHPAPIHLCDPGPDFVTQLRPDLTLTTVAQLRDQPYAGERFAKPANCKIEWFPAAFYAFTDLPLDRLQPDTQLLHTELRLSLVEEHRVWVLDGTPATSSIYLRHHPDGHQETWHPDLTSQRSADAIAVARQVLQGTPTPPTLVLDLGLLNSGEWVPIETNPTWSSATYSGNPTEIVRCILAAATANPTPWDWQPDPHLLTRTMRQHPLRPERRPEHTEQSVPREGQPPGS